MSIIPKPLPSVEIVRAALDYDPNTGRLTWRYRHDCPPEWNARFSGAEAGSPHSKGYIRIMLDGERYFAHRLAWCHAYGEDPHNDLDHINRNKTDNRIANLRKATDYENMSNRSAPNKDGRTSYLGVDQMPDGLFRAQIRFYDNRFYIGRFDTAKDAYRAYVGVKRLLQSIVDGRRRLPIIDRAD
jgi:hypothetical protein